MWVGFAFAGALCVAVIMGAVYLHGEITYGIPIRGSEIIHHGDVHFDYIPARPEYNFSGILTEVVFVDDGSIIVTFGRDDGTKAFTSYPESDHRRRFVPGDSFPVMCYRTGAGGTYMGMFEYDATVIRDGLTVARMIHGNVASDRGFPCDFPEIIDFSTNVFSFHGLLYTKIPAQAGTGGR